MLAKAAIAAKDVIRLLSNFFLYAALMISFGLQAEDLTWQANGPNGFSAQAKLSSASGSIPDAFTLTLRLAYPPTYYPDENALLTNLLSSNSIYPPFRLVEVRSNTNSWEYTLEPLLPGKFPLTFFTITFKPVAEESKDVEIISGILHYTSDLPKVAADFLTYAAPLLPMDTPIPLQVDGELRRSFTKSSALKDSQQAEIIESHAIPWRALFAMLLAGIVALALKLNPNPIQKNAPKQNLALDAFGQAMQLKYRLKDARGPAEIEALFSKLTDAFRYHIQKKYGLPAPVQTSEEFLQNMVTIDALDKRDMDGLKSFLIICDAAKFGKYQPTDMEIEKASTLVEDFLSIGFSIPNKGIENT